MEDCRFFGFCEEFKQTIEEEKKMNILQEASLKSLHKRMDEANTKRDIQGDKLDKLDKKFDSHMLLEERIQKAAAALLMLLIPIILSFFWFLNENSVETKLHMMELSHSIKNVSKEINNIKTESRREDAELFKLIKGNR